uniref:Potassium channel domain-containing protein n=1 Tax=Acrobeloides nanus TaxID=290746 RepID=A0A914C8Z8_9BILA
MPQKRSAILSSVESLEAGRKFRVNAPQVQINGIRNGTLNRNGGKFMKFSRNLSLNSMHSDSRKNLLLLQNVGRALERTHSHLKRTRLTHVFYLLALPVYTLLGALIFQALDGEHDHRMKHLYEKRCQDDRFERLHSLQNLCENSTQECFHQMKSYLEEIERCYRKWHENKRIVTHPMSDFSNAVIYAFSVYTSIGYGNISASSVGCRIATVIYGAFGIPLFFAFIKEQGIQFRSWFIWVYMKVKTWRQKTCFDFSRLFRRGKIDKLAEKSRPDSPSAIAILVESSIEANPAAKPALVHRYSMESFTQETNGCALERRRVFISGVVIFILYLFAISALFAYTTEWDYFTAFYFLFNSVALIGFGDVFPSQPKIILVNMVSIVLGVVLFSMCYFILQEEIREKAFVASRKARMSISKYSHSIMLHTKNPWSRRNSPAFDHASLPEGSAFDQLKKRRQSAPVITIDNKKLAPP